MLNLLVDRASYPVATMTGRKRTYTLIDWSKGFKTGIISLDDGSGLKKTRTLDMYYALADGAKASEENFSDATKVRAFVKGPDGLVLTITGN